MDAIVTVLIIAGLSAITFLIAMVKEKPGKRKSSEELNYLYTYRSILKQAASIEKELDSLSNRSYFTHMDINLIKQQTRAQITELIKTYEQGITTEHAVQEQLNQLNGRIQSLVYAVAV